MVIRRCFVVVEGPACHAGVVVQYFFPPLGLVFGFVVFGFMKSPPFGIGTLNGSDLCSDRQAIPFRLPKLRD